MTQGIIIAAIGGALAYGLTRKKKRKRKSPSVHIVDSGIGYSEKLGLGVKWTITRAGSKFRWTWEAQIPELAEEYKQPTSDSQGGFPTEIDAWLDLELQLQLKPVPKPEEPLEGGDEPLPPPPAPAPSGGSPADISFGAPVGPGAVGPVALPPPAVTFASKVYPVGAPKASLPPMTQSDGFVVSEDCNIAGIGPTWWDAIGERVEELVGDGVVEQNTILEILAEEWFPVSEIHLCQGPAIIFTELTGRVRDYLEENNLL